MVKVQVADKNYYLDGILKKNLDRVKENIRKDWDYLYVIDGIVGAGKSVFAQQIAHYVSGGKLTVDKICFNPEQFKEAVLKANKYEAVVFDEAFRGLSARAAMTKTNRILTAMLQEIRQKNLFVFVVLPSIHDLDKYVSLHRSKGLFHVYTDKNKQRGFFRFYKQQSIQWLMGQGQKMRYRYPSGAQFRGRFTKFYPIDQEAYLKKKKKSLGDYSYEPKVPHKQIRLEETRAILLEVCLKHYSFRKLGEITGIDRKTLGTWRLTAHKDEV